MTQDEIIEMAVQAGMAEEIAAFNIPIIATFAKLVAAKAIAELESQEPVAWRDRTYGTLMHQEWQNADPLYIHPPQRKENT